MKRSRSRWKKVPGAGAGAGQKRTGSATLIQTYKLVNNIDTDNSELWFERADSSRVTRNNTVRRDLVPKRDRQDFRRNFLSSRVIVTWNSWPEAVRDVPTPVISFKRMYYTGATWEGTVAPAMHIAQHHRATTEQEVRNILIGVLCGSSHKLIPSKDPKEMNADPQLWVSLR